MRSSDKRTSDFIEFTEQPSHFTHFKRLVDNDWIHNLQQTK